MGRERVVTLLFIAIAALAFLSACASKPAPRAARILTATPLPLITPIVSSKTSREVPTVVPWATPFTPTPPPYPTELSGAAMAAREDAAAWLGVPVGETVLWSVRPVMWEDASMGCPEPGKQYAREPVPGYLMSVGDLKGRSGSYHTDLNGTSLTACDLPGYPATRVPGYTPTPPTPTPTTVSRDAIVDMARNDLARKLGVSVEGVSVFDVQNTLVTADLRCPTPGVLYYARMYPGYVILLAVGDQVYEYQSKGDQPITCLPPRSVESVASEATPTPTADVFVEAAKRMLVSDLMLPYGESIKVVSVQPGRWSDSSLGCPEPNLRYEQIEASGYIIQLEARGQVFEFHVNASGRQVENCSRTLLPTPTLTTYPTLTVPPTPTGLSPEEQIKLELGRWHGVPPDDIVIVEDLPAGKSTYFEGCQRSTSATAEGRILKLGLPGGNVVVYYVDPKGNFEICSL